MLVAVWQHAVFSVPAVFLNCLFFTLFSFMFCWTKQFWREHYSLKVNSIASTSSSELCFCLNWEKNFSKREEAGWVFMHGASDTSSTKGQDGKNLCSTLERFMLHKSSCLWCHYKLELSMLKLGMSTIFLTPCLSFLKPSCYLLLSVIFVWESCLTQPNKTKVNKSEVSYGDSDKVS